MWHCSEIANHFLSVTFLVFVLSSLLQYCIEFGNFNVTVFDRLSGSVVSLNRLTFYELDAQTRFKGFLLIKDAKNASASAYSDLLVVLTAKR